MHAGSTCLLLHCCLLLRRSYFGELRVEVKGKMQVVSLNVSLSEAFGLQVSLDAMESSPVCTGLPVWLHVLLREEHPWCFDDDFLE